MKILLAEDETQLNRVITVALEREGYSVDSVFNGQDAVEKATTNHYHLMIFDIMMPIKTGSLSRSRNYWLGSVLLPAVWRTIPQIRSN